MEKPTIIYIYDALCGWCYGFSPVMQKLYEEYQDRFRFEVLCGGLITGPRIQPIAGMADYIRQSSALLQEVTGLSPSERFHRRILKKGTYLNNSLPPAIALQIFKEHFVEQQLPVAQEIQRLFYEEGEDLNLAASYFPLVKELGLEQETFIKKFNDPAYAEKAHEEFAQVKRWGIDGFPAVLGKKGKELFLMAHGYEPYGFFAEKVVPLLEGDPIS
jgi:putative protein-disulfide isomerase